MYCISEQQRPAPPKYYSIGAPHRQIDDPVPPFHEREKRRPAAPDPNRPIPRFMTRKTAAPRAARTIVLSPFITCKT